jgi:site-specific recombinase XerD
MPAENPFMQNEQLLTAEQTARILEVNTFTIDTLVNAGKIPFITITSSTGKTSVRFSPQEIASWLKKGGSNDIGNETYIAQLKEQYRGEFPEALETLKRLNAQIIPPRQPKGYSLSKVGNKKYGFIYYVRYITRGKLIPTRWSTHTNNLDLAEQFARDNRDRLLAERGIRQTQKKASREIIQIMEAYYAENSSFLLEDRRRGRSLKDNTRALYHAFMLNKFIPYLKDEGADSLAAIDTPFMARFQNHLLRGNMKPQTINHAVSAINKIFEHLLLIGSCSINPCAGLAALKITEEDVTERGCYDLALVRGVFNRRWEDERSYLLCLLIYATDMRNCEISRIQVHDLITVEGVSFIQIPKSKSRYGTRIVPLHPFVHKKLLRYIKQREKGPDDYIFSRGKKLQSRAWTKAYHNMGTLLGYNDERLAAEHITFYSGRHFWKTLMNAENLGDAEEYFMGHKVSADVAKRYNHRDKQGQAKIAEKAKEIFGILDRRLFTRTKAAPPPVPARG